MESALALTVAIMGLFGPVMYPVNYSSPSTSIAFYIVLYLVCLFRFSCKRVHKGKSDLLKVDHFLGFSSWMFLDLNYEQLYLCLEGMSCLFFFPNTSKGIDARKCSLKFKTFTGKILCTCYLLKYHFDNF